MASRLFLCGRLSAQFSFVSLAGKSMSLQRLCISRFHLASAFFGDAVKILMPSLSPTMQQGTIVKWYKKEGDPVAPGDLLCDIQTDKAVVGFEVEEEGILAKILKPDNSPDVTIGSLIALVVEPGADWKNVAVPAETTRAKPISTAAAEGVVASPIGAAQQTSVASQSQASTLDIHSLGPAVRLLLEQYNIQPSAVSATGPHNRLLKGDLLKFIKARNLTPVPQAVVAPPPSPAVAPALPGTLKQTDVPKPKTAKPVAAKSADFVDIELSNMRTVIAKRLTAAKQTIPHSYATVECGIDNLMEMRKRLADEGVKVGVNDFIIKAAAVALQRVPEVNAIWSGDAPRLLSNIDISVAVATDNGLITPIVKNAIGLGVDEIAAAVKDLASRARAGKLKLDEFQGGSFTISNLGMFGITSFSAVINPPQACILAVGASRRIVQINDDETISSATVVPMTAAYDGRIIDDALAAAFLSTIRDILENPVLMLSHRSPPVAESHYDLQKLFAK